MTDWIQFHIEIETNQLGDKEFSLRQWSAYDSVRLEEKLSELATVKADIEFYENEIREMITIKKRHE